jgi:uncharacterized glyoxalase superfamily protein PhnB
MSNALNINNLAPILLVDAIEPCLPFWVDRLGFEVTVTVPDQGPLAFAILAQGGVEIMLQSRASAGDDLGDIGVIGPGMIYIRVQALDPVLARLSPVDIVVPRRRTFYGADEVYARDPFGNVVGFAAPG